MNKFNENIYSQIIFNEKDLEKVNYKKYWYWSFKEIMEYKTWDTFESNVLINKWKLAQNRKTVNLFFAKVKDNKEYIQLFDTDAKFTNFIDNKSFFKKKYYNKFEFDIEYTIKNKGEDTRYVIERESVYVVVNNEYNLKIIEKNRLDSEKLKEIIPLLEKKEIKWLEKVKFNNEYINMLVKNTVILIKSELC